MRGYRHEALDGVRGLAAQVVLLGHALELAFPGAGPLPALVSWVSRLAVMVFFCLSGFVIATSLARLTRTSPDRFLLPYAVHRAARIWPPLAAAVALTFAVAAVGRAGLPLVGLRAADPDGGPAAFLRGLVLAFAPHDATFALDGPLWTLRQEVWLYGIAALVALAIVRGGVARLAAGIAALAMVAATADRFFYPQSLCLFGCGAAAALMGGAGRAGALARSRLTLPALAALAAAPLPVLGADAAFVDAMSNAPGFLAFQALLGVPLALAVLGLALGDGPIVRGLVRLRGAGAFSYTLYVVHNPLLVLAFSARAALGWLPGPGGAALTLLLALPVVEVAAWSLARLVERPRLFRALAFRALAAAGLHRPAAGEAA